MQIVTRNANGSGKKVLKTVRENKNRNLTYMEITNSHEAWYYSYSSYSPWVKKTIRF